MEAVAEVAAALTAIVTRPTPKGQASAEVTALVRRSLGTPCARCAADHVPDGLFRAAGRQARLVLGAADQRATMLHPTPDHPQDDADHPLQRLLDAYFRVNGPTSRTQFRDWMQGGAAVTDALWQDTGASLVRAQVENRRYDLPATLVDDLAGAAPARGAVLVPPHDPYLRQVNRTLLVPGSARRGEVWRALSAPGALLVDGEVAGTWRYRRSDNELTITPFDTLTSAQRKQAEPSAGLVVAAGGDQPTVRWD